MDLFNSYGFIMAAALAVIISFLFSRFSDRTSIPSVLMLILLGIVVQQVIQAFNLLQDINLMPILEITGIIGLIMIVLEAALDLHLTRNKGGMILRAFFTALIGVAVCAFLIGLIIKTIFTTDWFIALLYSIPLAIMSSAIVLPSIGSLTEKRREFLIYEATFSDILGIMFFYFLLESTKVSNTGELFGHISINILITVALSFIISYILIVLFQKIKSGTKFFLLLAVLVFLYSFGKSLHLSSLLIILVFGLILRNSHIFTSGKMASMLKIKSTENLLKEFSMITVESAFLVRTFFFIIFGMSIVLSKLLELQTLMVSLLIIVSIYLSRYLLLRIFKGRTFLTEVFVAPRGLITILLFFSIPASYHTEFHKEFEGVLLYVILISSILMAWTLIRDKKDMKPDGVEFEVTESSIEENDVEPISESNE